VTRRRNAWPKNPPSGAASLPGPPPPSGSLPTPDLPPPLGFVSFVAFGALPPLSDSYPAADPPPPSGLCRSPPPGAPPPPLDPDSPDDISLVRCKKSQRRHWSKRCASVSVMITASRTSKPDELVYRFNQGDDVNLSFTISTGSNARNELQTIGTFVSPMPNETSARFKPDVTLCVTR
jgi:hypothetical protein